MPIVDSEDGAPVASVIVPSYNTQRTIMRCLESLHRQRFERAYEIIVVDSSEDDTPTIIQRHFPQVRLLERPQRTLPGAARNVGAEAARAEIILFTDADCMVSDDWLEKHVGHHTEWAVVGGAMDNANPESWVGWAGFLSEFNGFTPTPTQTTSNNLVTANVSYKRSLFEGDRFDEDIFPGEDRLFHQRISQQVPCLLDRTILVKHINRTRLSDFLRHQARLGQASAQARKRESSLPGSFLVRHRFLVFLTPITRTAALLKRIGQDTPSMLVQAIMTLPLIMLGAFYWASRFFRESKTKRSP